MLRADRVFAALVLLALVSSAVLIALLAAVLSRIDLIIARGASDPGDLVAVLLLLLASLGICLGVVSLVRQLCATHALIRSLLTRRIDTPARVRAAADGLGIDDRLDVVRDAAPFSFCYWFVRPRICISTGLAARLDAEELRAVLLHERYHLRQRDPLRLVVARYFAAGLYVIPAVEDLVEHFALEKEIEADEHAVTAMGDVRPLARALYALLPDADAVSLGLLTPVGALSVTEARIDHLVEGRALPLAISPASGGLSFGALVAAAVLVGDPPLLVVPAACLVMVAAVAGAVQQVRLVVR